MDGNNHNPLYEPYSDKEEEATSVISVEQLQRLVRLFDQGDVSELELRRVEEGTRVVLRKIKAPEQSIQLIEESLVIASAPDAEPKKVDTKHTVVAPLVGIFHASAKPKGGALVAVGDRVKAGQLVATIQSLNVINEVETTVAGHVVEILVQDGQPVEYGQSLMTIDSTEVD